MAFPTTLQDLDATRGTTNEKLNNVTHNHITHHALEDSTIEAIEAKVGADSSAVTTSHDYKLGEVTGSDKAVGKTATQTLTSKTLTAPTIADFTNATHDHGDADDGGSLATNAVVTTNITDENVTSRKLAPTIIVESCTGDTLINSTSNIDVTGCTSTFTPAIASYAIVTASFGWSGSTNNGDAFVGLLNVDTVDNSLGCTYTVPTGGLNIGGFQQWVIPLTAASHTLKLVGKRTGGSGSTNLSVETKLMIQLIGDDNVTNS